MTDRVRCTETCSYVYLCGIVRFRELFHFIWMKWNVTWCVLINLLNRHVGGSHFV